MTIRFEHWVPVAPDGDPAGPLLCRIAASLNADRTRKAQQIQALERDIAALLVQLPYVLLLSVPGINVVSAAEFAGEAGPIEHYPRASHITGRAGVYPSRYQSEQVDHDDGPLVKRANRRLRFALLQIADNLVLCNQYFARRALDWQARGIDPRAARVRVAHRFSRIAFQMVAGQEVFRHPATQERHQILNKLVTFHQEHQTPADQVLQDLQAARNRLPAHTHADEAAPLRAVLEALPRRRGPQPLGEILPLVLAKLPGARVQSNMSGPGDST